VAHRIGHAGAEADLAVGSALRAWVSVADLDGYRAGLERSVEIYQGASLPYSVFSEGLLALVPFWRGNWEEARDSTQDLVARSRTRAVGVWTGTLWSQLFLFQCMLERTDAALPLLAEAEPLLPRGDEAATVGAWTALFGVIEGLAILGRSEESHQLYAAAVGGLRTGAVITHDGRRLLQTAAGIAAAAGGDWERAEHHYETALRQAHDIPFRSEQAEARRWYAEMLMARDRPEDRRRAAMLLDEAIRVYSELRMPRHRKLAETRMSTRRY
jgi:hypothetical protein